MKHATNLVLSPTLVGVAEAIAFARRAELDLSYTRIHAPVDGIMSDSKVDPGNLVGAGEQTLLTTLVKYDPIHAYFSISEREVLRILDGRYQSKQSKRGRPVFIGRATDSDFPFAGELDFVDSVVDEETGTFIGVRAGTVVFFQLRIRAGSVVPGPEPRRFLLEIVFRGDRRTRLGSRVIELVIPGADGEGCEDM